MVVVTAAAPTLEPYVTLARALIRGAAPFQVASDAQTLEVLTAERGLQERRARIEEASVLLAEAEASFTELEDRRALEQVAKATPLLVASQAEPEALALLARTHLLAGAIFVARGRLDAAQQRLQRALDIDPEITPPASLRLLGALEAVRARSKRRQRGWIFVELAGTATAGVVFLDGRKIGVAPGRFEDILQGRHLIRVSARDREGHAGTLAVRAGTGSTMQVHLPIDETRARFRELGPRLAFGGSVRVAQSRLSERARVDRTLVASVVPGHRRGPDAGLTLALIVDLQGSGRARVEHLDRVESAAVLRALARCEGPAWPGEAPVALAAPSFPDRSPPRSGPMAPTPGREPMWKKPWFWATTALLTVGLVGGLAAAHGASGAPDDLAITLVPRP